MFTGLVQTIGTIREIRPVPTGARLVVDPGDWTHRPSPGDSIAVSGCCLTLAPDDAAGDGLPFDVVPQTLRLTTLGRRRPGDRVNLEHAATPTTLLGGHLVQGHVEGLGEVVAVRTDGGEHRLRIRIPETLRPYLVAQGSITLDGVSLTVATVHDDGFDVALVPTTVRATTLGAASVGTVLNVETDCIMRMVARMVERTRPDDPVTP
ncbi:MAG: riboflavin synthase [Phycisphaerales bacterium]|nr:riboflavin synthase [Phycisphaerales bacterium]